MGEKEKNRSVLVELSLEQAPIKINTTRNRRAHLLNQLSEILLVTIVTFAIIFLHSSANPSNLITTNCLRLYVFDSIGKEFTRVLTSTKSKVIFLPFRFHLVMRSIVLKLIDTSLTCVQPFGNARIKTQYVQGFFSATPKRRMEKIAAATTTTSRTNNPTTSTKTNIYYIHLNMYFFCSSPRFFCVHAHAEKSYIIR